LAASLQMSHEVDTRAFSWLQVQVLRAKNLTAMDFDGSSDPYVLMYVRTPLAELVNEKRTAVIKTSLNPDWTTHSEGVTTWTPFYNTHLAGFKATEIVLHFQVMDYDLGTSDDTIGTVSMSLADLMTYAHHATADSRWFDIPGTKGGQLQIHFAGLDKIPKA